MRLLSNVEFLFVAGGGLLTDGYLNTTIGLGKSASSLLKQRQLCLHLESGTNPWIHLLERQ